MSRIVRLVTAVLVVLGLSAAIPAAAAQRPRAAAASEGQITVLTFNMCGEHCNADSTSDDITDLMAKIDAYHPDAVLLQEVCGNQFAALSSLSQQDDHWALTGGDQDITEPHGCAGGDSFGDGVLVHGSATTYAEKKLKYPHGHGKNRQVRKVMCVRSTDAFPRQTTVCTVHAGLDFEIGKKHQAKQVKQAYTFARKQDPSSPLIFGGDFNVVPKANALDPVYATGGGGAHGAMEEVDACPGKHGRKHHTTTCNRFTHDPTRDVKHRTKNDYVFGSHKSFKGESATIVPSDFSDHDLLVGSLFECASGVC
jgi:endonuclease/exonuclease/phosphatase (EEP) superfamily protein YafD